MKVVATSDIHYRYDFDIPECDVFIVAGDILGNGKHKQLIEFNTFLEKQKHNFKHCLVTPGNHDACFETDLNLSRQFLSNATVVVDDEIEIEGKRFYFSPWTPAFLNWYWMFRHREHAQKTWELIPENLDVLVTHGPPYGILDKTDGMYNGIEENVGCKDLKDWLDVLIHPPKFHVFGHIHHSYGKLEIDHTTYMNVSYCNEKYQGVNAPMEFEI